MFMFKFEFEIVVLCIGAGGFSSEGAGGSIEPQNLGGGVGKRAQFTGTINLL